MDKPKTTRPPGPYTCPEGSTETTYKVVITTVFPMLHTDPINWSLDALIDELQNHHWCEVESTPLIPAATDDQAICVHCDKSHHIDDDHQCEGGE